MKIGRLNLVVVVQAVLLIALTLMVGPVAEALYQLLSS